MQTQISCHKVAVFSDIHSNYHAFHACFEDAKSHGADCFLFLGDYISDLADPRKTLDLVYKIRSQYPTVCLRGNRERYMLEHAAGTMPFSHGSKSGSLLFTFEQLRQRDLDFFAALPIYEQIEINGVAFELTHASKEDDRCYFESGDDQIKEIFTKMETPYLLTGHAHKQYIQRFNGRTIINPGSIGVPFGSHGRAQYALLEMPNGSVNCTLRSVPYDLAATIRAQFENGLITYAKYWAISVLYDIITGEEHTMQLLTQVSRCGDVQDEENWFNVARELKMKFTEREILEDMKSIETAYFAGGCFWCITPTFKETPGVLDVVSGYSGGDEVNPTYAEVKTQKTRHRETIRIDFDPVTVTFEELLNIFLSSVDPFDADGQFIDRGHSYTLAVYYCSEIQCQAAEAAVSALADTSGQDVYISVEPFTAFYRAEEEHQDYYLKNPEKFKQELIDSGRIKA